jgi:hypothetical protein
MLTPKGEMDGLGFLIAFSLPGMLVIGMVYLAVRIVQIVKNKYGE